MTLESALIPIPSEVTMPFAGSLVTSGQFNFWVLILIGTSANLTGSLLAFALGFLGEKQAVSFIRKYGKFVLIREKEYEHAKRLFAKYGEAITLVSRVLPAIRTYISLPAGIAKMDLKKFIFYTALGSFIWSTCLTFFGAKLGENWHSLSGYFHKFDLTIVIVGVTAISAYIYSHLRSKS